eukprot:gene23641-25142_t
MLRRKSDEFDYGYALTVHKAQGSQWDEVVLFDESGAFREHRARWLYTGVTRAAAKLTVVIRSATAAGSPSAEGVVVRIAGPADIAALVAIETEVFAYEQLTRRAFRRYLGLPTAVCLVAQFDTSVVGYALATFRARGNSAWLASLAVTGRASGRGIGERLLRAVHEVSAARGARRVRLELRPDNMAGLGLYLRLGYQVTGRRPGYYCDGADAVRMEVRLAGVADGSAGGSPSGPA